MKKKGFTLIELLAVIVILAIIALIAVPIVLNMIENARKSAAKSSAYGYIQAIDDNNELAGMSGNNMENIPTKIEDGVYDNVSAIDIKIKGKKPTSGSLTIVDGKVSTATNLCFNDYKVSYETPEVTTIVKGCSSTTPTYTTYTVGSPVYFNPVSNTKCTESDAAANIDSTTNRPTAKKDGCMKWYVITTEDTTSDSTIDVILDHNTSGDVAWNTSGSNSSMNQVAERLTSDTSGWDTEVKTTARLITADEVAHIVGADRDDTVKWKSNKMWNNTSTNLDTQITYFYLDGAKSANPTSYSSSNGWQKQYANSNTKSDYSWLYDNLYDCLTMGCRQEDNKRLPYGTTSSTEYMYGYWTSTPAVTNSMNSAWRVGRNGNLDDRRADVSNNHGVRPVITISKTILD